MIRSTQSTAAESIRLQIDAMRDMPDTPRVADLRQRVRDAMDSPPAWWQCPEAIDNIDPAEPVATRKARAIALKLSAMSPDLWDGQLLAGSMTLEDPRLHMEHGLPRYLAERELADGKARGLGTGCFGHIVPDYPRLLAEGLRGIKARAEAQCAHAASAKEVAFLASTVVAVDGVMAFAARLADHCDEQSQASSDPARAGELHQMALNLRQVPAGPAKTFWQALQSVWLLHMIFHCTGNGNAVGRIDQYAWRYLEADLASGAIDLPRAAELVTCFCLKFNERAKTTDEQAPDHRSAEPLDASRRTRHTTSSQFGRHRDGLDATNHWLQNIVIGGITPEGADGTNPLSYMLLESYRRNRMTNPLLTARLHRGSPDGLVDYCCDVLKDGGGMPALFNDDQIIPAIEKIGIPPADARDYTNDGCWETIIPGRTDFRFQRLSMLLCLEWALNRGRSRIGGEQHGLDMGEARQFDSFDDVWRAMCGQIDAMVAGVVQRVIDHIDDRGILAPVPLLSAMIDGAIENRRDMTEGGAKFRTFGMLAESAAHAIDSLAAIKTVIFDQGKFTMADLCDALDANFEGYDALRRAMEAGPKYGNDDPDADEMGRRLIDAFSGSVAKHGGPHGSRMLFPCGVATFSWYIGIGEGLGPSPDGRRSGEPVSSNFSPALGRDTHGLPGAILSYAGMQNYNLPAGGPLDLRVNRSAIDGPEGMRRMAGLLRTFVDTGGSMMTLTVADAEQLREAQRQPAEHRSLRVRMGGWSAYFTMLSREQQNHQIRRQEGQA